MKICLFEPIFYKIEDKNRRLSPTVDKMLDLSSNLSFHPMGDSISFDGITVLKFLTERKYAVLGCCNQ